jgi:hypothetical protein
MKLTKKIQVKNLEHDRSIVERLVEENITGKLDSYLRRYKEGTVCSLTVSVSGNKKGNFSGSVMLDADGAVYRSERDDYKNLDDLVNHLFDHIKEQLSKSKR